MGRGFRTPSGVMLAVQVGFWAIALQASTAHAQLVPSASGASAPVEDPMERAKRQANNVMRWIKVHAEKPRAAPAAAPTPPPAPAAPRPVAPKAVAPVVTAATAPVEPEPQKAEVAAPPPVEVPVVVPVVVPAPVEPPKAPPPPPEEEEEVPLKAIAQPQPSIPHNLRNTLTAGKVMVRFTVEANGQTSNVEILTSSNRRLNQPTITAVTSWQFEPIKAARVAQLEFDFLPQQ